MPFIRKKFVCYVYCGPYYLDVWGAPHVYLYGGVICPQTRTIKLEMLCAIFRISSLLLPDMPYLARISQ